MAQNMEHPTINRENPSSNPVQSCGTLHKFVHPTLLQCILLSLRVYIMYKQWLIFMYECSSRINISVAERFLRKSKWCSIERFEQSRWFDTPLHKKLPF